LWLRITGRLKALSPGRHRLRLFPGESSGGINDDDKRDATGFSGHRNQCPGCERLFHRGDHPSAISAPCGIRSNAGVVDIGDVRGSARQEIPLNESELSAVDDGVVAMETLLEPLADVPTPAGPTPRELGNRVRKGKGGMEANVWGRSGSKDETRPHID
jgi:hypothetical protein